MGLALAGIARLAIKKFLSLSLVRSITERYWRNDILFAIRRALTGFFIFTAAFFASVTLLPHIELALGNFPTFTVAANIAGLGYFATAVMFCLRLVRSVQNCRTSERWDGRVFPFQVTDFKPDCVEIRILASAIDASVTFDLRCEIREHLLSFLQVRYPGAFR
jgi:hypothetical protein